MQNRDVTYILFEENYLAIACDNSASLGESKYDIVNVDLEIVAEFCLRTPLLELICVGAKPLAVINTIGNEMFPIGEKIISGLKKAIKNSPFPDLLLSGSTEENMPSFSTNIGITVVGKIDSPPSSNIVPHTKLWLLGELYVGESVLANIENIIDYQTVMEIMKISGVLDIIPIGSKGILYEASIMAGHKKIFPVFTDESINIYESSGPSTALLVATDPEVDLHHRYKQIKLIGEYRDKGELNA
ncbi:TPA: hypothetical protein IUT93_002689 [Enterococcus faecalis]|uniref:hypothetical protein n=1 Tax=Enterococcus faecalis TaxID=1351 RepID=UPI000CF6F200|nr:hypothetical protein [Enterococcus faecalis]PQC14608.1 hypothetical protein CUM91_06275 [Enterococcus faecalis]HAP3815345.1 hypothetical protein [Enterococcus faecalis]